ncbi:MAG TPA: hypothetical protein PKA60_01830 [Candidatus Paceibacterota bacterium]|nr:hypothetical protein [Candidatus Paceibacterota bacterium]
MVYKKTTTELSKKKRRKFFFRIIIIVLLVVGTFYGLFYLSNYEPIQISEIEITGQKNVESPEILFIFEKNVANKYLKLFSKRNIFLLPKNSIINEIEEILTVDSAYIKIDSISKIKIEIIEHEPWAIWCSVPEKCYLVNRNGLAFVTAPIIIVEDLVKISSDQDASLILGKKFTEKDLFNRFVLIQNLLSKINISISKITTADNQTFVLQTKDGPQLFIDDKSDPIEVVNNLKTTIEQESIHEIQFKNLEYVDLRFSGKAYYKIK